MVSGCLGGWVRVVRFMGWGGIGGCVCGAGLRSGGFVGRLVGWGEVVFWEEGTGR